MNDILSFFEKKDIDFSDPEFMALRERFIFLPNRTKSRLVRSWWNQIGKEFDPDKENREEKIPPYDQRSKYIRAVRFLKYIGISWDHLRKNVEINYYKKDYANFYRTINIYIYFLEHIDTIQAIFHRNKLCKDMWNYIEEFGIVGIPSQIPTQVSKKIIPKKKPRKRGYKGDTTFTAWDNYQLHI